jgi:hypothetical protein
VSVAERMRRCRQRRRAGAAVLKIVVKPEGCADLVALGWLRPGASPVEVKVALLLLIEAAVDAGLTPRSDA